MDFGLDFDVARHCFVVTSIDYTRTPRCLGLKSFESEGEAKRFKYERLPVFTERGIQRLIREFK